MANKVITTSTDITSLIATGLGDGQNIDINGGAVLTYDVSPSVLIGQTRINDGKMILDGASATNPIIFCGEEAEEINVNGAGTLETTLGWYTFVSTSSGLSGYTFSVATYFSDDTVNNITADIFCGMWVETGRRLNYDTAAGVAPVVGDWLFKSSDNDVMGRIHSIGVGYVVLEDLTGPIADNDAIELHTIQDNNGPDYQKSWTALANGADVIELDVWTKWANTYQNGADRMGNVGNGNDGRVFHNAPGTNTITFGDGTNGRIPPSGCQFKVPMVHFCSSTLASYATGDATTPTGTGTPHNVETSLGGDVSLRGASIGSAILADSGAASWVGEYCTMSIVFGSAICGSKVLLTECMLIGSMFNAATSMRKYPFETSDLVSGAEITDCAIYHLHPNGAESGYLGGVTSNDISYTRCVQVTCTTNEESLFNTVSGVTLYDVEIYGGDMDFTTSSGIDMRLLKIQAVVGPIARNTQPMVTIQKATKGVYISGVEILKGSIHANSIFNIGDSSGIKIRGLHFYGDPVDFGGFGTYLIRTTGLTSDVDAARLHRFNSATDEAYIGVATAANITLTNITNDYDGEIDPKGTNIKLRMVGGGSGNLGATNGMETDHTGSFGSNANCIIRSDTSGAIALSFMPDSADYPFTNIVGNPKFTKDGDFDVKTLDSFTITTDKFYGITSFTGVLTTSRASGSVSDGTDEIGGNVTIEMQYDDGMGYNGTWLDCKVPADMTGIPDLSAGAVFKIRLTATGSRINNNGVLVHFNTSIAALSGNLFPIDQDTATLTLTGVSPLSDVVILAAGTNTVLASVDQGGTTFDFIYNVGAGDIDIGVLKSGKVPLYQYGFSLASTDSTLPINQLADRNFQ